MQQNPYLYSNFIFNKMKYEYIKNTKGIGTIKIIDNPDYEVLLNLSNIVNIINTDINITNKDTFDNIQIKYKSKNLIYYIYIYNINDQNNNIILYIYENDNFYNEPNVEVLSKVINDGFTNRYKFNRYITMYKTYKKEWSEILNYNKSLYSKYLKYKNKYIKLKKNIN
jgi:hypothetical protein